MNTDGGISAGLVCVVGAVFVAILSDGPVR